MYQERKEDLSVYYWLVNNFSAYPNITIVDGFQQENLIIPSISSEATSIAAEPFELGNRTRLQIRVWQIDIYAVNKSQRDEFAYKILNELYENIDVYNYDEGFPPGSSPSRIGSLILDDVRVDFIKIFPELVDKLYYRASITFAAHYGQI